MCFMMRAAVLGLEVSKPWGDTAHYDFVVERARHMARVQVKSTISRYHTGYSCKVRDCHGGAYHGDPFDFVAAYLILEDIWYIIPAKILRGKSSVGLYPRLKWSKYEPFREAWHLLPGKSPQSGIVESIEACAGGGISFPFSILDSQELRPQMLLAGI
jgi:hypothetical protein